MGLLLNGQVVFRFHLRRLAEQGGHHQAQQAEHGEDRHKERIVGGQGAEGLVKPQPPDRPEQCRSRDAEGTYSRPSEADGILRGKRRTLEDGVQHPEPLEENQRGTDAADHQEQGD